MDDIDIAGDKVVTISVSDLNGKYFIDNVQNPVLTFVKGFTYKFLYPNILSHPLRFSTTSDGTHGVGTIYSDGVTTGETPNYIQIVVTDTTPTTLYYFCTAHTNMGNSINVLSDILNVEADRGLVYIEPSRTATTGSNKFVGDQDFTGSVNITGSISLNGEPIGTGKLDEVDFNSYTSSTDDRLDDLETESGSVRTDFNSYTSSNDSTNTTQNSRLDSLESESGSIRDDFNTITGSYGDRLDSIESTTSSLNSYTSSNDSTNTSQNNRLDSLESTTGSLNDYTSSNDDRLDLIEISTGSLNQFTSSINTTIKNKLNTENVVSGAIQVDITGTSGYTTFSSSIALTTNNIGGRVDDLETESGSIRTDFNSYTSSTDVRLSSIESATGSQNDRLDSIEISTGSLNQFTSSINTTIKNRLNAEDVITGSIQVDITGTSGYTTFSSSISSTINQVSSSLSSSVAGHNLIQDGRLNSLEGKTGSYSTTGSNNFFGDQYITGSVIISDNLTVLGSSSIVYSTASQLIVEDNVIVVNSSFPAERFAGIEVHDSGSNGSVTASLFWDGLNNRWIYQNTSEANYGGGMFIAGPRNTGSLGDEPGLTSGKLPKSIGGDHIGDSIMNEDGSTIHITGSLSATSTVYGTNITAIEVSTGSLNQFSSSLLAAVELTGSNLTVKGDLLVKGTTTNVNTTTLDVDNNLINLNGTGATLAGLRVKDTTLPNKVSGSLLWDATNDYWIAGQLGSEQRIVRETEFNNSVTRIGNLEVASGSIRTDFNSYTSSNNTTNTTQNSRLTSLESATGSYTTTDYFVTGATFGTGDGIVTLTKNDGNTVTVDLDGRYLQSHPSVVAATSSDNSGRTYIQDILLYSFGHITGITTGEETVVNTDTNYYVTGATWGSSTGVITLTRNDGNTVTVDIDGRYLESYTETDTLATVTARGASTTDNITITASGTANSPLLRLNPTNAISFVHSLEIMASGLTSTQAVILPIGVVGSAKNAAYIGYKYSGTAGSNDNLLSFGHWGADHLMTMNGQGNVSITGTISASNFSGTSSGTNTGDQTLSGLGGQAQLNGTGFVKANGTTISYDNSTYQTVGATHFVGTTSIANNRSSASQTLTGVSIDGSASSATLLTASGGLTTQQGSGTVGYVYALTTSTAGIFSVVDNSNSILTVNRHPDNYYSQLGFSSNGNIYYRSFSATAINTSQAWQTIWTSSSLTNLNQLSNGPGYLTGNQTITLTGDASGSGTTSITVTVDGIDGVGFRNTGNNAGVNAQTLDSNGMTYVTDVDNASTNLTGNSTDGALYSQIYSSSWQHQIYGDYRTGIMYVRGKNNNSWQSWKRVALSNATTFTNVSSVTFNHTLGTANLTAQVFDTNGDMFFPSNIRITSTQVIVTFSTNRSGRLVVTG